MIDTFFDDGPVNIDESVDAMLNNLVQNRQDLQPIIDSLGGALGASISASDRHLAQVTKPLKSTLTRSVNASNGALQQVIAPLQTALGVNMAESAATLNPIMAMAPSAMFRPNFTPGYPAPIPAVQPPTSPPPHMLIGPPVAPPTAAPPSQIAPPPGAEMASRCVQTPNSWSILFDVDNGMVAAVCEQDPGAVEMARANGWQDTPLAPPVSDIPAAAMPSYLQRNMSSFVQIIAALKQV